MVVSSAADFDNVAVPLGAELQALGATVKFGCVSYAWYTWKDGRHDPSWRATYRESFGDSDFDIVVAMSVVTEPAELITIAKAAVVETSYSGRETPIAYSSIGVILAASVHGVREAFGAAETLDQVPENKQTWIVGTVETDIRHSGPVSPAMKRAGVVDTFKSAHVYPNYLLSFGTFGAPGRWEGSRPTRPGFISGEEDMMHDFDEYDRRNAGVMTPEKRYAIVRAAERQGYSESDDEMSLLSSLYDVPVEDAKRVVAEARSEKTAPVQPKAYTPVTAHAFDEATVLAAAAEEFNLAHPMEGQAEECGRRAAIRGLMVRLGLYDKFLSASKVKS
ncbi:hypothetical protein [Rhizobium sp. BK176]|uniref:hypothetical protein n=1 Tax=Rhizobium sp. BK176 TaxID=2587071 RepID=UPI002167D61B|nr:hypothetical protein [Rhizobium sp. BK176]MCS4088479.1 hypothetical protein [Rhizobium sp. BK176]